VPLLRTVPGIAWVLAYTIASEIGEISRFPSPRPRPPPVVGLTHGPPS
jgi:transposase